MVLGAPRMRPFARDCGIVLSLLLSFTGNVRSQPPSCGGGYRSVGIFPYGYCDPCPPGYYKSNFASVYQTWCDPCQPGTNAVNSYSFSCSSCLKNFYSYGAARYCEPCPANSGNLAAGSGSCFCNVGYTGPDSGTCSACVAGTYKATTGAATCTACPSGKVTTSTGQTAATACVCPVNSYSGLGCVESTTWNGGYGLCPTYSGGNNGWCGADKACPHCCINCADECSPDQLDDFYQILCLSCPANSQSVAGSTAIAGCTCNAGFSGPDGGTCSACAAGKYKANPGSAGCTDCLANSYHALTGRTAVSDCQCNAGTRVGVACACACPLCLPALL